MNPIYEEMKTSVFERMSGLAAQHGAVNLGQGFPDFGWPPKKSSRQPRRRWRKGRTNMRRRGDFRRCARRSPRITTGSSGRARSQPQVCVTSGATEALGSAILAAVEPGDEVIIFTPAYDSYAPMIRRAGANAGRGRASPPAMADRAGSASGRGQAKTCAILFNNPQNPTGRLFDAAELEAVAAVARKHDLLVIADEVWEHVVLDGARFMPIATRRWPSGRSGRLRREDFFAHGLEGGMDRRRARARRGRGASPPVSDLLDGAQPPVRRRLGLDEGDLWLQPMRDRFQHSRDMMTRAWARRLHRSRREATYFLCVDLDASGIDIDDERSQRPPSARAGVAVVPISAFAEIEPSRHLVRLCFGKKDETIEAGVAAMAKARELPA